MIKPIKSAAISSALLFSLALSSIDLCQAQTPVRVYVEPAPVVTVSRPIYHHRIYYAPTVPAQVTYTTYYAPQVPVIPMASVPVRTVSAYYVPTVPVVQQYAVPVVRARRARRYWVPAVAVRPVYWVGY